MKSSTSTPRAFDAACDRIDFATLETTARAWQRRSMTLYTRPQLTVLLLVVITAGIGLGVGHWRRTHPELTERLERFDRAAPAAPATVDDPPRAVPRPRAE